MNKNRIDTIDLLRAIAIIVVMISHTLSYNLGTQLINTVWNYLHFAVPIFIFCSGYLTYRKYASVRWTKKELLVWYKTRSLRLLIPYYIFTAIHYALWLLLPAFFSGGGLSIASSSVFLSFWLVGVDYGWLPLLFLQLMIITPVCLTLLRSKFPHWLLFSVPLMSAVLLVFFDITLDYRLLMWVPWSGILLLSFVSAKHDIVNSRNPYTLLGLTAGALGVFVAGTHVLTLLNQPLTLTLHKYPPDMYYLSFGYGIGSLILYMAPAILNHVAWVITPLRWLSQYSYELFFANYVVIDLMQTQLHKEGIHMSVSAQCLLSVTASVIFIYLYKALYKRTPQISGRLLR